MRSFIPVIAVLGVAANAMVILPRGLDNQTAISSCLASGLSSYTVSGGDTLSSIAEQFKSGICNIKYLNDIENIDSIPAGANYQIPTNCTTPDNTSCVTVVPVGVNTCVSGLGSTYDVRQGDTLTKISEAFNITLASLIAANPQVTNPDLITVGQILNVPICPNSKCASVGTYVLNEGDTFYLLSQQYGTTVGQIQALNVGAVPEKLPVGATIILPQNCNSEPIAC